jgi:ABC-type nickel/cobalt efflux system permease component RcnA
MLACACLALALAAALWPAAIAAHPLGNFTVNRYSRLEFANDAVTITYVLDMAEVPTYQELHDLDADADGRVTPDEGNAYLDAKVPAWVAQLTLSVGGQAIPLNVLDRGAVLLPGQGGLQVLRVAVHLRGVLPDGWRVDGAARYADHNFGERIGWHEIVVQGGAGIVIRNSSAPAVDESHELTSYPQDALAHTLNLTEATFTLAPGDAGPAPTSASAATTGGDARLGDGGASTAHITALVTATRLTPTVIVLALLAACFWGGVHALTPGHGKTIVAAYLVGARGTARHALFLGLTVTATHTAGVFALAGVTLWLSRYILPETLYPWLSLVSGLLVVGMGVTLALSRLRAAFWKPDERGPSVRVPAHDAALADTAAVATRAHTHTHLPPGADGAPVTWRSLLALGISGGLIPCPSALILLLGAIALDRLEFGIVLVLAFSLGLASVLTGVGLLLVWGRRIVQRFSFELRVLRVLPIASALVISIAGVILVVGSLDKTGLL